MPKSYARKVSNLHRLSVVLAKRKPLVKRHAHCVSGWRFSHFTILWRMRFSETFYIH